MKYIGEECPVCSKIFQENDDIVVCPDCGTPHHRSCWQKNNECFNHSKHEEGFAYYVQINEPPKPKAKSEHSENNTSKGQPFTVPFPNFVHEEEIKIDLSENSSDKVEEIDGIKVEDFISFVGFSSVYYLPLFYKFSKGEKKFSFNFFAGFIYPINQLYRKMNFLGIILSVINLLLNITNFGLFISNDQYTAMLSFLNMSENSFMLATNYINIFLMVIISLFNDRLYFSFVKHKIRSIRNRYTDEKEYRSELVRAGSPSLLKAFLIYFAINVFGLALLMQFL